jgi:hypothetical protein
MMTIERLRDQIRLTFSEEVIETERAERRSGEDRRRPRTRVDSWPMAKMRARFIAEEVGHAAVNLPKEFMVDRLGVSERRADRVKVPMTVAAVVAAYLASGWALCKIVLLLNGLGKVVVT